MTSSTQSRSFADYGQAGFTESLLPAAPPGAILTRRSKIKPGSLGKVPSCYSPGGWYGFRNWQHHKTTTDELNRWDQWRKLHSGANICLRGDLFPAADIDVDDPELSSALLAVIRSVIDGPIRRVRSKDGRMGSRFLMLFRGEEVSSWTTSFLYKGQPHMVELKGSRRQCLVEGRHKSGGSYAWSAPHPVEIGAEHLPELTKELGAHLKELLETAIRRAGGQNLNSASPSRLQRLRGKGQPAQSLEALRAALAVMPNTNDTTREEWVAVAHAIKGASRAFEADGRDAFIEWSEGYEGNTPDAAADLWDSINSSDTGWLELARRASRATMGSSIRRSTSSTRTQANPCGLLVMAWTTCSRSRSGLSGKS